MFTNLGHLAVRRRRLILAISAALLVVAGWFGTGAFGLLKGGGFNDPSSESSAAEELLITEFSQTSADVVAIVSPRPGTLDTPEVETEAAMFVSRIKAVEGISSVVSYWETGKPAALRSIDGERALVLINLDPRLDEDASDKSVTDLLSELEETTVGGRPVEWAGVGPVFAALNTQIADDLALAQAIALPITLLLLVVVFRSLVAATLPLLIGVLSIVGTFFVLFVLASITDVSIYAINLTTALGLGLGIDFSLFMVSRFREELKRGRTVEGAVVRTVETAGRTIFFSGATTMLSLSALIVFPLYFLRSFAYAGAATVALATAAALVTLPALLAVVGTRVDRFSFGRKPTAVNPDAGRLAALARRVMARPVGVATVVIVLLLAAGAPFLRAEFSTPDHRVLTEGTPAREANELLRSEFGSTESNAFGVVAVGVPALSSTANQVSSAISQLDGVARVDAATGAWVDGALVAEPFADPSGFASSAATRWSVVPDVEPTSTAGQDLVRSIRSLDFGDQIDLQVGGGAAELIDTKAAIADRLPLAATIIVLTTLGLMFLLLGSVLLPIKAVILNLLSLTATYGAMVWVFQDGNFSGVLGFTPTGAIDTTMPILMFCVAFGLSMDYEVFLLSRIREEHDLGADIETATARGIQRTGGIVTASAMLLAVTFGAFVAGGTTFIKLFGLGLTIAVVADAFFVRITLVPAAMKIAGERTWWAPSWLAALHRKVEGLPAVPDSPAPLEDNMPVA